MSRLNQVGRLLATLLLIGGTWTFIACSDAETKPAAPTPSKSTNPPTPPAPKPMPPDEVDAPETHDDPNALVDRGRSVYNANCIACHNTEPGVDGTLGPAIAGSSLELIEARVMRNEYPEGYAPKRNTKAMIALPYLEPDLAALAAYLAK